MNKIDNQECRKFKNRALKMCQKHHNNENFMKQYLKNDRHQCLTCQQWLLLIITNRLKKIRNEEFKC